MAPVRRPDASPALTVEVSPAYELLQTIHVLLSEGDDDTYDIGQAWRDELRGRLGDDLIERTRAVSMGQGDTFIDLVGLVYDTPAPRTLDAFIEHLRATDPQEILLHLVQFYSREMRRQTAPSVIRAAIGGDPEAQAEFLRTCFPEWEHWTEYLRQVMAVEPATYRDDLVAVLEGWAQAWKPESPTIIPILERDAEAKRELQRDLPIDQFITTATNGVEFAPRPGIDRVVMVPSFVNRPTVTYYEYGEVMLILYPVADESVTAEADAPPLRLVRLSKALGDEKRLRILRALAEGDKTLMELADMFGVAKTTMHHHMIVLRSAGLISVGVGQKTYRLRQEAIPNVGTLLSGYLGAAVGPSTASGSPAPARRSRRRAAGG